MAKTSENGRVYLFRLNPSECPAIYKVGFSTQWPRRLKAIKTVAPNAMMVGVWAGSRKEEHSVLSGLKAYKPREIGEDEIRHIGNEIFSLPNSVSDCQVFGDGGALCDVFIEMIVEGWFR